MTGFLGISKLYIPEDSLALVYSHLRKMGDKGLEGVALFAGTELNNEFHVAAAFIPAQTAMNVEHGLLYTVSGEELYRINKWLYENKMSLVAQIHSHPGRAYHSETDDAFPIVATVGAVSIVVPDFATGPISPNLWAVYRLSAENVWNRLTASQVNDFVEIVC